MHLGNFVTIYETQTKSHHSEPRRQDTELCIMGAKDIFALKLHQPSPRGFHGIHSMSRDIEVVKETLNPLKIFPNSSSHHITNYSFHFPFYFLFWRIFSSSMHACTFCSTHLRPKQLNLLIYARLKVY